jgi:protease I
MLSIALQEEGLTTVVAAPERRRYQMVLHEVSPGWTITREWQGYGIDADVAFADVAPEERRWPNAAST